MELSWGGAQIFYKNIFTLSSHFMKKLRNYFKAILDLPDGLVLPDTAI